MGTKGELLRAAPLLLRRAAEAGRSIATFPLAEAAAAQRRLEDVGAVREDRARSAVACSIQRVGVSLFTLIAIVSIVLAAATIWLFLTNPVTVATAVNEGEITPLVRNLAQALYAALSGHPEIPVASSGSARLRSTRDRRSCSGRRSCSPPRAPRSRCATHQARVAADSSALLQKPRQNPAVDELERRLAGAVVAAAQHRDLVRDAELAERADQILREIDRKRQVVARVDEQRLPIAQPLEIPRAG